MMKSEISDKTRDKLDGYERSNLCFSRSKIKDKKKAMADAIVQTFKSILGSSLTTFAGFLALCTMDLLLGKDIGIVMAKGVLCGLICVVTIFPSFLLIFDKQIEKTKHTMNKTNFL